MSPVNMRCLAVLAVPCFGLACYGYSTEAAARPPDGAYTLESVDQRGLPARIGYDGDSSQVVTGSLDLQPNGYFVLAERDTVWNGHAWVRNDWTDGGTWTADGSLLILDDTTSRQSDAYGAATSTYIGTMTAHAVSLTIPTNDGGEAHVYRYDR